MWNLVGQVEGVWFGPMDNKQQSKILMMCLYFDFLKITWVVV